MDVLDKRFNIWDLNHEMLGGYASEVSNYQPMTSEGWRDHTGMEGYPCIDMEQKHGVPTKKLPSYGCNHLFWGGQKPVVIHVYPLVMAYPLVMFKKLLKMIQSQ